jgi:hypothetical protein
MKVQFEKSEVTIYQLKKVNVLENLDEIIQVVERAC